MIKPGKSIAPQNLEDVCLQNTNGPIKYFKLKGKYGFHKQLFDFDFDFFDNFKRDGIQNWSPYVGMGGYTIWITGFKVNGSTEIKEYPKDNDDVTAVCVGLVKDSDFELAHYEENEAGGGDAQMMDTSTSFISHV